MWFAAYNILLILATPVIVCVLMAKKRCRPGFWSRFGIRRPTLPFNGFPTLWVHAVSLGESLAVVPLVKALHQQFPSFPIVVSTVTETGREAVEKNLGGIASHCYLPLDYPWAIDRYITWLHPALFILVETELWPNLLHSFHRHGIPTILVNGRISSRSFPRYLWLRSFMKRILSMMTLCLMQSPRDVERLCRMGAHPHRVHCTGNMKFDQVPGTDLHTPQCSVTSLGLLTDELLIVAGSTHCEEEALLLTAYQSLIDQGVLAVLLLAPRHIERVDEVEKRIVAMGLSCVRRSHIDPLSHAPRLQGPRVIILDTRGELRQVYGFCRVAFVGGTLTPVGGHNLLEPAVWGKPVVFGPYTDHCEDIADLLLKTGGGIRVSNGDELMQVFRKGIEDQSWAERVGHLGHEAIIANQGVVRRNLGEICAILDVKLGSS